jgi:Ni,Fe-hydrogenase III large subunit
MKKLLGICNDGNLIIQDNSNIFLLKDDVNNYKNFELIKNRNEFIKDPFAKEVSGDGVFNFRYGPVTGGVGEAGTYNLYTYGERILYVKIDTSYKRRKIEDMMLEKSLEEGLKLSQYVCGNFSVSHSLAYTRAVEKALQIDVNEDIQRIRSIGLELERIYNHIYVISRLASAAAQSVLASHLEGLFESSLRANKLFLKSRYLKDLNKIGGVKSPDRESLELVKNEINRILSDFEKLFENSMKSGNYIDRLHSTATIDLETASQIGLTGPSLRACKTKEDLRLNEDIYKDLQIIEDEEGDSLSRMEVRAHEIMESCKFILNQMDKIKFNLEISDPKASEGEGLGWSESPSGSVAYRVKIKDNKIDSVYISTPSVFGFAAIVNSMVGNIFTDFPFAVESFGVNFADAAR